MNLNPRLQFRRFLFSSSPFRCWLPCSVKRPSPSATIVAGSEAPPPPSSLPLAPPISQSPTLTSPLSSSAIGAPFLPHGSPSASLLLPLLQIRHQDIIDRLDTSLNQNSQRHVHIFAWNHDFYRTELSSVVPDLSTRSEVNLLC